MQRTNAIEGVTIKKANLSDLQQVLDYHENCVGIKGSWLQPYCIGLIEKRELVLFLLHGEIIGTGEKRLNERQQGYASLGVTVSKEYRRRGLASYILFHLKTDCYEHQLVPICSTSINNIGSQGKTPQGLVAHCGVVS